jgi:cytochrome P450
MMASSTVVGGETYSVAVVLGCLAVLTSVAYYLFSRPSFPKNAPPLTSEAFPVIGSLQFFTERWDFFQRAAALSKSNHFSFYAGQWPVVALRGEEGRKVFFESKSLGFAEGYGALLQGSPPVKKDNNPLEETGGYQKDFSAYFSKRIVTLLKGNTLKQGLPRMLKDARAAFDKLAADPSRTTDPFDSIYRLVYLFTMRTVACNEIADNPALLAKTLGLFESVEGAVSPLLIMYPWLPLWGKLKRISGGGQLYMILKGIVDTRKKTGTRGEDALQYLMDQGDSLMEMIIFITGALFAGQLNSGINAAHILIYLASNPYWMQRVREEIETVANRYSSDPSAPLKERLMSVPIEAWESEFTLTDLCLRETIRLQLPGNAFRKNISDEAIPLNKEGTEVIPPGTYATYATGDVHLDPSIYSDPLEWDPSRHLPERAEDKKALYAYMGWGVVSQLRCRC